MKMLQLYNQYRSLRSGEERVVFDVMELMEKKGVDAKLLMKSSRGIEDRLSLKIGAFVRGIYNTSAYHEMTELLREVRPDLVHVNNLYPVFSPSVLVACRRQGIPIVMTIQNYALTCPTAHHLCRSIICEQCLGGREYYCVLRNCRENIFESLAYSIRSAVARKMRFFQDNVTLYIVPTQFTKRRLIEAGFQEDRIILLRNMVIARDGPTDASKGRYVAFAGRMSAEKGVDTLLSAAKRLPEIPIQLAGEGPMLARLRKEAPPTANFLGLLEGEAMAAFYRGTRFLVVPSRWFEMCPLVISQAFAHGLPVIASRIGGLGELVDDGVTGFLFEPGNAEDLANKIQLLWNKPALCREMGKLAYTRTIQELGEDVYFGRLMAVYEKAIERNRVDREHGQ